MNIKKMLSLAADISRLKRDDRNYFLGAVGVRADGVLVCAYNGAPKFPEPRHHCEFRLCRKLSRYSEVYVARTLADGSWGNAYPCIHCRNRMAASRVTRCFYTIGPGEYGCVEGL